MHKRSDGKSGVPVVAPRAEAGVVIDLTDDLSLFAVCGCGQSASRGPVTGAVVRQIRAFIELHASCGFRTAPVLRRG